jgi:hypothetical protein
MRFRETGQAGGKSVGPMLEAADQTGALKPVEQDGQVGVGDAYHTASLAGVCNSEGGHARGVAGGAWWRAPIALLDCLAAGSACANAEVALRLRQRLPSAFPSVR